MVNIKKIVNENETQLISLETSFDNSYFAKFFNKKYSIKHSLPISANTIQVHRIHRYLFTGFTHYFRRCFIMIAVKFL